MFRLSCLAVTAALAMAKGVNYENKEAFVSFMNKYEKKYSSEDTYNRYRIFSENMKHIEEHNAKGEHQLAVNEFADLTPEEFSTLYKGYNHRDNDYARSQNLHVNSGKPIASDVTIDWVEKEVVTPVKNQASCGSCWAFSTTGSIEGAAALKSGKLISLSEQELVDCAGSSGNQGCNGGLMDDAFEWVIKNGGIDTESQYAYTGKGGKCSEKPSAVKITGFKDVKKGSEADLMDALTNQPVSIAVDAGGLGWQLYHGGIMKAGFFGCSGKQLDHGVLLVGAGTENGVDYWKVKNSWGATWGEKGYIRIKRGIDACGLADSASYPTV